MAYQDQGNIGQPKFLGRKITFIVVRKRSGYLAELAACILLVSFGGSGERG